jgi:hypothetical protein
MENKLSDIFQGGTTVKEAIKVDKARLARDYRLRKGMAIQGQVKDIDGFLRKNKHAKIALMKDYEKEKERLSKYELLSQNKNELIASNQK